MVKATHNTKADRTDQYPALYRNNHNGGIVLFISASAGTLVMASGKTKGRLGDALCNWHPCTNMNTWTRLSPGESVTLTQE